MNSYKAVIFDFNGTLFFDNDKHVKAWGKISQLIRVHGISEEELHSHFNGVPNAKIIQYLLQGNGTEDQIEKYSCLKEEFYRILCKEDTPTFHLVDGANEYFDLLKKKNIPFTIASASIKDNIDFFVESFNLANWMNPNDIVYDDGTYENKIMMFKDAAKKLDTPIEDCLIIEDSISGIKNGFEAGCRNIIVVDSANKQDEYQKLPGVKRVIKTFNELLES